MDSYNMFSIFNVSENDIERVQINFVLAGQGTFQ